MIRFTDVYMRYAAGTDALKRINLYIEQGAMVYITGRSGAGKSTLLRLIALIERHTRGQIIVNGQNLERVPEKKIPLLRRSIGFMFQDHRLLNDRSVFDNVALPLVIAGHRYQDIKRRVHAALDKVSLLSKERSLPPALSGGEQQRVGIARAIVHRPAVLLADEPTGNLDPGLSWGTMKLFEQFNQVGVTVLIASHDLDMIRKMKKKHYHPARWSHSHPYRQHRPGMRKRRARTFSIGTLKRGFLTWLAQHAQACIFSVGQFFKNPLSSLMTTAVIGVSLALPTGFYMLLENANRLTGHWDGAIQITLFLKRDVADARANELAERLRRFEQVETVRVISRHDALAEYQRVSGFDQVIDALGENPLPSILLVRPAITLLHSGQVDRLLSELRALTETDSAEFDRLWVKRLLAIIDILQRSIIILSALLALAVLLIVGNTIRLAIYNRRAEIEIHKLFGATNAFIRRPFLYAGLVHGLGGSLIAWLLLQLSVMTLQGRISELAQLYHSNFVLSGPSLIQTLILFAIGGALGLIGSSLAVTQHLKAIEPA